MKGEAALHCRLANTNMILASAGAGNHSKLVWCKFGVDLFENGAPVNLMVYHHFTYDNSQKDSGGIGHRGIPIFRHTQILYGWLWIAAYLPIVFI